VSTLLVVFIVGYRPFPIVFNDHDVCHQVQWSLEVQELDHKSLKPKQLYEQGHRPGVFFISCKDYKIL